MLVPNQCDGKRETEASTWISVAHVQVVATADAGGVERVNAEGGELAPELLEVAVLTVQRHLEFQTHLVLFGYELNDRHEQTFTRGSSSFPLLKVRISPKLVRG